MSVPQYAPKQSPSPAKRYFSPPHRREWPSCRSAATSSETTAPPENPNRPNSIPVGRAALPPPISHRQPPDPKQNHHPRYPVYLSCRGDSGIARFVQLSHKNDKQKSRPPGRQQKKDILSDVLVLALPIFTARHQATIVGVSELNFCVRDGNRWTLTTINTNSHRIGF